MARRLRWSRFGRSLREAAPVCLIRHTELRARPRMKSSWSDTWMAIPQRSTSCSAATSRGLFPTSCSGPGPRIARKTSTRTSFSGSTARASATTPGAHSHRGSSRSLIACSSTISGGPIGRTSFRSKSETSTRAARARATGWPSASSSRSCSTPSRPRSGTSSSARRVKAPAMRSSQPSSAGRSMPSRRWPREPRSVCALPRHSPEQGSWGRVRHGE